MIIFESDIAKEILSEYGCTNIQPYTLVNNSGLTFDYNEQHYDARHWRNVYGVSTNYWSIVGKKHDKILDRIEKDLNDKCLKPELV